MRYKVKWLHPTVKMPYLIANRYRKGSGFRIGWTANLNDATPLTEKEIREIYPRGIDNIKLIPEPGEIECNTTKRCIDTAQIEERDAKV